MATYNQVSYGSKGSDVTELQKLLNNNGYNLSVDGAFGSQTQAAVKDYQQKNNLAVDGIVGDNTWGSLTGTISRQPSSPTSLKKSGEQTISRKPSSPTGATGSGQLLNGAAQPGAPSATGKPIGSTDGSSYQYPGYNPSDAVIQAQKLLEEQSSNKPGDYQSNWQTQINDILDKILNREKFSYDLNGDALYQQYKDQFTTQGKMAMMDTMGQAQAMTGGYGNSYAQNVGQQAYQGYLQQLNDKVPELYQLALSQYQMEGDALTDQYALLAEQENQDYGRYRDQVGDWWNERDYLTDRYDSERDYDYSKWADNRDFDYNKYRDDRDYDYQRDRDKVADEQWQKEFDEAKRQFDEQMDLKNGKSGGGSGGSSGSGRSAGSSGGGYNNQGYSADLVKKAQEYIGASADGKWGSESTEKAKAKGYSSIAQVLNAMGYTPKGALAGNDNSGVDPSPAPTRDFKWVGQQVNDYIANGASKSKISKFIAQALSAGYITPAQANSLKSTFVPRGYTY